MHLVMKFHSLARSLHQKKVPLIPDLIYKFMRVFFCCDIKYTVQFGEGVKLYHNALGVVIHKKAVIGNNVSIYQNVTLGGNGKKEELNGAPTISDNVVIGVGAVILGPVLIGEGAKIGANAVVITNILAGRTAVGVPARMTE